MRSITIAIASAGRPSLLGTLGSLERIGLPEDCSVRLLVADDDPGGGAGRLLAGRPAGRFPLEVVAVGSRNIARARNACLAAATGSHLAFLDDDEWVAPDWLVRMLACLDEHRADIVIGPVHPQYPAGTPDWLVRANPLYVDWGRRGRRLETGRTGNALIDRAVLERTGVRFDEALGRTGGEDTELFAGLARAGARIVATDDAMVYEHVPPERLEPRELRLRAVRKGQSYARFRLRHGAAGSWRRLAFFADAAGKLVLAIIAELACRPLDRARAFRWRLARWSNLGKLREAAGLDLPRLY